MQQNFEQPTLTTENVQYESPRVEIIEIDIEGPILQMSAEDSDLQYW